MINPRVFTSGEVESSTFCVVPFTITCVCYVYASCVEVRYPPLTEGASVILPNVRSACNPADKAKAWLLEEVFVISGSPLYNLYFDCRPEASGLRCLAD